MQTYNSACFTGNSACFTNGITCWYSLKKWSALGGHMMCPAATIKVS